MEMTQEMGSAGAAARDILVVPFFGQGHLFPGGELCKRLSSHNCKTILLIPSYLSSSITSDLHLHPSVEVVLIETSSSPPPETALTPDASDGDSSEPGTRSARGRRHPHHQQLGQGIESFLAERYQNVRPAFVVIDVMMSWSKDIFKKANIPIVSFFTSGACTTAMEYAAPPRERGRRHSTGTDQPPRIVPGLPDGMALSHSDIRRRDRQRGGRRGRGRRPGGPNRGPPRSEQPPIRWIEQTEGSTALLINTCDDLEGPFLKYLAGHIEKPVFGVGPLLPDTFWKSIGSVVHDRDSRPDRDANYTEDEVIEWLDSKPRGSVIYVSFGSEIGPSIEEYDALAEALAETDKSFIWVIQPGAGKPGPSAKMFGGKVKSDDSSEEEGGYEPHGLEERVGKRGLIIKGWAPQLSILSHPSTGGFLSHCGWNSTVEAICCGVPILAWPIGRDQFYDANLVVKYLNVGHKVLSSDDLSPLVTKAHISKGIETVMNDEELRDRAIALRGVFENGYPSSSSASLKALIELISK